MGEKYIVSQVGLKHEAIQNLGKCLVRDGHEPNYNPNWVGLIDQDLAHHSVCKSPINKPGFYANHLVCNVGSQARYAVA